MLFALQTAEFMGSDPFMAALGVRISLVAYPVVALRKVRLWDACVVYNLRMQICMQCHCMVELASERQCAAFLRLLGALTPKGL